MWKQHSGPPSNRWMQPCVRSNCAWQDARHHGSPQYRAHSMPASSVSSAIEHTMMSLHCDTSWLDWVLQTWWTTVLASSSDRCLWCGHRSIRAYLHFMCSVIFLSLLKWPHLLWDVAPKWKTRRCFTVAYVTGQLNAELLSVIAVVHTVINRIWRVQCNPQGYIHTILF